MASYKPGPITVMVVPASPVDHPTPATVVSAVTLAVSSTGWPSQAALPACNAITGLSKMSMVTVSVRTQPAGLDAVTQYTPLVSTVMVWMESPVLHSMSSALGLIPQFRFTVSPSHSCWSGPSSIWATLAVTKMLSS